MGQFEIFWAYDELGQMPLDGARKARMFVSIDSELSTAQLRVMSRDANGDVVPADYPLERVERSGSDLVFWCSDGVVFVLTPSPCSCGMGMVAYTPVWPGATLTRVRVPAWLTEVE